MINDREDDRVATPMEAVYEYARNAGADYPERAWLLHDWDVWVANPHYTGPPVPHPEDDCWDYDSDAGLIENEGQEKERLYDRLATEAHGSEPEPFEDPEPKPFEVDDEIPF